LTTSELIDHYADLIRRYPILFIEDGLQENDFSGFAEIGGGCRACRGRRPVRQQPGPPGQGGAGAGGQRDPAEGQQVGTVSEALVTAGTAQALKYDVVASVRSGETDDAVQVDLAVAGQPSS